mgnify:CR=1 FL=1
MSKEDIDEPKICGEVFTKRDEFNFFAADVYPNQEGNICIRLDDESHIILSPIMAKRLRSKIDEAIRDSLGMVLAEE